MRIKRFVVVFMILMVITSTSGWLFGSRRRRRRRCGTAPCKWNWGTCTRRCGGGTQKPVVTKHQEPCGSCTLPNPRSCNHQCCPKNCVWGSWGHYSVCSKTCGGGYQTKERSILIVNTCAGRSCIGSSKETKKCNTNCCPSNCKWGNWGSWEQCSKSCGGGSQKRSRKVTQKESCGGSCNGPLIETRPCGLVCCPVDCKWGDWGSLGPCSVTCGGGTRSRYRHPVQVADCGGKSCRGSFQERIDCAQQCCPVDCKWGNWGQFLDCSASCGGGVQHRSRRILVHEECGGDECHGKDLDDRVCNTDDCCRGFLNC